MADPARLIQHFADHFGVDPVAALIVALGEGGLRRGGGIGDAGTSFGPFQLHEGGALPSRFRGRRDAAQRWAWSRPGIRYAVRQMAGVSRGMEGRRAIENIIRRFERPADPDASVAAALERLRSGAHKPYLGHGRVGAPPGRAIALSHMPAQANAYGLRQLSAYGSPGSVLTGLFPGSPESHPGLGAPAPSGLTTDDLAAQLAALRRTLLA